MKHNFSPIQNSLENILKKYNLYESFELHQVFNQWETIVGSKLSGISEPVHYNRNKKILTIRLQSESWRNEFSRQKSVLLKKLNKNLDTVEVSDLIFE
jgi:predicted nucleic acid-binding Zn ribbon protein